MAGVGVGAGEVLGRGGFHALGFHEWGAEELKGCSDMYSFFSVQGAGGVTIRCGRQGWLLSPFFSVWGGQERNIRHSTKVRCLDASARIGRPSASSSKKTRRIGKKRNNRDNMYTSPEHHFFGRKLIKS